MTFEEWKKLVKGLKSVYTSERFLPDREAVQIWYSMLKDMDYKVLSIAAQKYMVTGKFPPTVAELRECAVEVLEPKVKEDYSHGWEQVMKAVSKYGYCGAEEALASMDPVTRKCVKRLGWKNICTSENQIADRANFRQIYEQEKRRHREHLQLPEAVRESIAVISNEVKKIETSKNQAEIEKEILRVTEADGQGGKADSKFSY